MQTAFAGVEPRTQSRAAFRIAPVPCLCTVCVALIPDTERYENQRRALPDFHEKLRYLPHVVVPEVENTVRFEFLRAQREPFNAPVDIAVYARIVVL